MITRTFGERAVLVELDDLEAVHRLWSSLRADPPPGVEESVAGATTVLLLMAPGVAPTIADFDLDRRLREAVSEARVSRQVEIAVAYDGPDLAEVAAATGLSSDEVVRRHSSQLYTVGFLGFSPGFAYLFGGDPSLAVARLERPRKEVPAGSVALAAGMTAIYPQSTAGGWRLIATTGEKMFDPSRPRPSLLEPGDRVRLIPSVARSRSDRGHRPTVGREGHLRVLDPGPLTTVQDRGRAGWAHLGVPRAGAADVGSAALANRLVGNPPGAAVLESTMAGPRLLLGTTRRVAITGARADVTIDGLPARQDTALLLDAGHEIVVGRFHAGVRAYLAVEGGIEVDTVLGSRSSDTFSNMGPPPLQTGDVLAVGPRPSSPQSLSPAKPTPPLPRPGDLIDLEALLGPRHDWVGPEGISVLATAEFTVSHSTDRTGVRLEGPVVPVATAAELPSEGMVPGAIQIPRGGGPIVLMRNHQTTGGYPVAAVLVEDDVDRLSQAPPGVRVRLRIT